MASSEKTWVDDSPPQAAAADLNGFKNENTNLISGSGQIADDADNQQTHKAVSHYAAGGDFYVDVGAVNAYVLNAGGSRVAPPGYFDGMQARFIVGTANTGASTVNVGGGGVANVYQKRGSTTPLAAGQMSGEVILEHDGSNFFLVFSQSAGGLLFQNEETHEVSTGDGGTFGVPDGVYLLWISLQGGGGGGASGFEINPYSSNIRGASGGGGSGAYIEFLLKVTPGDLLAWTQGAFGEGGLGAAFANGNDGVNSTMAGFSAGSGGGGKGGDVSPPLLAGASNFGGLPGTVSGSNSAATIIKSMPGGFGHTGSLIYIDDLGTPSEWAMKGGHGAPSPGYGGGKGANQTSPPAAFGGGGGGGNTWSGYTDPISSIFHGVGGTSGRVVIRW